MDAKDIKQDVKDTKRKLSKQTLIASLCVVFTAILIVIINYFLRFSFILTFIIFLLPVFVSSIANYLNYYQGNDYRFSGKLTVRFAVYGLTRDTRQSLYLLKNFGKTIAVFIATLSFLWIVLWLIPAYSKDIARITRTMFTADILQMNNNPIEFFDVNSKAQDVISTIIVISQGVAILYFIFKMLTTFKIISAKLLRLVPASNIQLPIIHVYRNHRRDYIKGLIYFNGFGFVLMALGYVVGAALVIHKGYYSLAMPVGTIFLLLMLIPVLQNSLVYEHSVLSNLRKEIYDTSAEALTAILKEFSKKDNLSDEEKEIIKNLINASEKNDNSSTKEENNNEDDQEKKRPD